jgi:cell division transport system permease protein
MKALKQRIILRLATLVTLSACFLVLFGAMLVAINMNRLLTMWGDDLQLTAYLTSEAEEKDLIRIEQEIKKNSKVGKVEFVSREKALSQFSVQMASSAPDLAGDQDLLSLIPASFQISLPTQTAAGTQESLMQTLAKDMSAIKGIEEVRYGQEWIKKYSTTLRIFKSVFLFIGIALLLASIFVISNSVRVSVESRREEIEVLELIGASFGEIRKPFIIEGALQGFISAAIAMTVCTALFFFVKNIISIELNSALLASHLLTFNIWQGLLLLVLSALVGSFAAFVCVARLNTGFAAAGEKF